MLRTTQLHTYNPRRYFTLLLTLIFVAGSVLGYFPMRASAASVQNANVRFVFTTDLHGQVTPMDYESGKSFPKGSLAQAYTLIKEARSEKRKGNTMTFDIGDVLFDYTTEYYLGHYPDKVQPIYNAMQEVGYDAITLGNHDFDYGYDYITSQLNESGMIEKTVLSNVTDSKTGENTFGGSKIITKSMTATDGKTKFDVNIGIIGETIPNLTNKTESYTGILKGEDIVTNVTRESEELKSQGADVVVVLAHSGFGPEEPDENYKNVTYALTKIDAVDVILSGHSHIAYPSEDTATANVYNLPGVDKETNLINGKVVAMSRNRGQSIGVVDLTLTNKNNDVSITKQSAAIRDVTEKTKADPAITKHNKSLETELIAFAKKEIGELSPDTPLNNFYGLLEDNSVLQLLNNAKMDYAIKQINTVKPEYKDYPVIAASSYASYGDNSIEDFTNLSGTIYGSNLNSLQPYNKYLALYTIKGSQLKQWLEWIASAYETTNTNHEWSDEFINNITEETNLSSLLDEEWLDNWANFLVFDGVEYTIDPSAEPRYDRTGNFLNNTNRITSLTYNGVPVSDDMTFVLACDRITTTVTANKGLENQYISKGFNLSQNIVSDYMKDISKAGPIHIKEDNNWRVNFPNDYQFIVKGVSGGDDFAMTSPWFVSKYAEFDNYSYSKANLNYNKTDTTGPNIVITPSVTVPTSEPYDLIIHATDGSKVTSLRYSQSSASSGIEVINNRVRITANGLYTITAKDSLGNETNQVFKVDNFNFGILRVPTIDTYTNRKSSITGKAPAGTTIHFETEDGNHYEERVKPDGTFTYALPNQPANSKVGVYVSDLSNRKSDVVTVKVKRTGPNQVTNDMISNTSDTIVGHTNDDDSKLFVIIGDTAYVSKTDGTAMYKACELYKKEKKIVKTDISVDDDGSFHISIPIQNANKNIYVHSVDHLGRVSKANKTAVTAVAPNPPTIYKAYNDTQQIAGKLYNPNGNIYDVFVEVGDKTYKGTTDFKGYYRVDVDSLKNKEKISVYATDMKDGQTRTSAVIQSSVNSLTDYINDKTDNDYVTFNPLLEHDTIISGVVTDTELPLNVYVNSVKYEPQVMSNGNFTINLSTPLTSDSKVYANSFNITGSMHDAAYASVKKAKAHAPIFIDGDITNATTVVRLSTNELCKVTLVVGDKTYTSSNGVYNDALKTYIYTIAITQADSSTEVKAYATNSAGDSDITTAFITKTAPDAPFIDQIELDPTDEKIVIIGGTIDIISDAFGSPLPTSVWVQVPGQELEYEGVVDTQGRFTVSIPLSKTTKGVSVFGSNGTRKGPSTTIVKASFVFD